MIRLIIFAVVGLVLGLGGGSGFSVMKAKKAAAAAHDSTTKGDSTLAEHKGAGEAHETPSAAEGKTHETPSAPEGKEHATASTDVSATDSAAVVAHETQKHDSTVSPAVGGHAPAPKPNVAKAPVVAPPKAAAVVKAPTAEPAKAPPARISKIFAAMSAKDAARVLEKLDDTDVQTVLSGLNEKQAAAILSGFPPERAAAISRAAIRGKKGAS